MLTWITLKSRKLTYSRRNSKNQAKKTAGPTDGFFPFEEPWLVKKTRLPKRPYLETDQNHRLVDHGFVDFDCVAKTTYSEVAFSAISK